MSEEGSHGSEAVLYLRGDEQTDPVARLSRHPLLVGRDAGADVVLPRNEVSRHHLLIWITRGVVRVRDVGSALGTRVGGTHLGPGDCVRVPARVDVVLAGGTRLYWNQDDCLDVAAPQALDPTDGVDTMPRLPPSPLGGGVTASGTITVECDRGSPRSVRLEGEDGQDVEIRGEARVVLVYMLADRGLAWSRGEAATAWIDDRDLAVGLWGARGADAPPGRLNTVISRVRDALVEAGFPRGLIEKRTGRTRLRPELANLVVDGCGS